MSEVRKHAANGEGKRSSDISPGQDDDHDHLDIWDIDEDDVAIERRIADKSLAKIEASFKNAGYKEGVNEAKFEYIQKGFDEAFEQGIQYGKRVGGAIGSLSALNEALLTLGKGPNPRVAAMIKQLEMLKHTQVFPPEYTTNIECPAVDSDCNNMPQRVRERLAQAEMLYYRVFADLLPTDHEGV